MKKGMKGVMNVDDFTRYLNEQLKDPVFKQEWDALESGRDLARTIGPDGSGNDE
jgi:hypothetical protein